jgi:peptidyl-prolyl cis-trans isomerase A (cyclophilin A)
MKNLIIIILLALLNFEAYPQKVKIHTSMGEITIKLEGDKAPKTVNNFMKYVQEGFYRGGSFFRTVREDNQENNPIKIEVIQAGCHPWKQNFLFDPIPLERTNKTGLKHKNGTISMAGSTLILHRIHSSFVLRINRNLTLVGSAILMGRDLQHLAR